MKKNHWTDEEVSLLTEVYPDTPTPEVAKYFDRRISQIYNKVHALGIKKSAEYLAGPHAQRLRRGDNVGEQYRFKPGAEPWNKGKPFEAGGRSHETRFKKGEMSGAAQHNYVPIGSTRLSKEGMLERKVSDDPDIYPAKRWQGVHRIVWESVNGPIAPKHVVRFKDGMFTNVEEEITIDRLECISMAENMRRNSYHRYPKDVALAIQMRGALNRKINHAEKQVDRRSTE